MRTYESEKENANELPKFYLGQEVEVPGGSRGVIRCLIFPTNGLYMSPEKAEANVWFGADNSAKLPKFGGKWSQFTFKLCEIKAIRNEVIDDVLQERNAQDAQRGGAKHDDAHDYEDFLGFIETQGEKIKNSLSAEEIRERFVKIAALAVATLESIDRKLDSFEVSK